MKACAYKCKLKASTVDKMAMRNSLLTAANEEAVRASQAANAGMADSTPSTQHEDELEQTGVDVII